MRNVVGRFQLVYMQHPDFKHLFNLLKKHFCPFQCQTFFIDFTTFRKLVVIQQILAIKTQTIHQMEDIIHGSMLVESIFEITYENVEKSVIENLIF